MSAPVEQITIGIFSVLAAIATGVFSLLAAKLGKKYNDVSKKERNNKKLKDENDLLEQIIPVFERKDEALDKMAEILDNILEAQEQTNQQIKGLRLTLEGRCQIMDALETLQHIISSAEKITVLKHSEQQKPPEQVDNMIDKVIDAYKSTKKGGDDVAG